MSQSERKRELQERLGTLRKRYQRLQAQEIDMLQQVHDLKKRRQDVGRAMDPLIKELHDLIWPREKGAA